MAGASDRSGVGLPIPCCGSFHDFGLIFKA